MTATAPSGRLSRIFLTTVVLPEPVPPAIPMISITWYINLKLLFDARCIVLRLTGDGDAWKKIRIVGGDIEQYEVHRVACGATGLFIALVVFPLFLCKNK